MSGRSSGDWQTRTLTAPADGQHPNQQHSRQQRLRRKPMALNLFLRMPLKRLLPGFPLRRLLSLSVMAGLVSSLLSGVQPSAVVLAAGTPPAKPATTPKAGAAKPAASGPSLPAGTVTFVGEQGLTLSAEYTPGKQKSTGLVLLHMDGRSSEDWKHFAEKMSKDGFHVLALDLRGHGKSTRLPGGKTLAYENLDETQYQLMVKDVGAAVTFLRTRTSANPDAIALVGASVGANLAIRYAATDPKISSVVLLSPGLDYKGLSSEDAVDRYGVRPLFIAVSREDNFAAKSSLVLDSTAKGIKLLKIFTGAGHGTKMMTREPSLELEMAGWLNGSYAGEGDDDILTPSQASPPIPRYRTQPSAPASGPSGK